MAEPKMPEHIQNAVLLASLHMSVRSAGEKRAVDKTYSRFVYHDASKNSETGWKAASKRPTKT
jgi:hypothetical protein